MNNKKSKKNGDRKVTTITIGDERKSISYHTTQELLEKTEKFRQKLNRKASPLFKDVAEEWQEQHDQEIELYTANGYKSPLRDIIKEVGDIEIRDVKPKDIQSLLNRMYRQGYAKQTIKLRLGVASQIFDYAIHNEYCDSNPAKVCSVSKKAPQKKRELPKKEDIVAITQNADSLIGLYLNLIMWTGLRREEALAITNKDIDFEKNLICVEKVLIFDSNKPIIKDRLKNSSSERYVPILPPLKDILQNSKVKGKHYLFEVNGKILNKGQFDGLMNKYKKKTGISCTSHQLRHYFATLCFESGLSPKSTQQILGHSKIDTTMDIYTHITQQKQITDYDVLADYVNGTQKK